MSQTANFVRRTQTAFILMRLLCTPCWYLLCMLTYILYKNMQMTPLHITAIIALKPASSLLSPYWTQAIFQRPDKIASNLIVANLLRHLPFLFLPWFNSPWLVIASFALYMTLTRATIPAWLEMFKHHLPKDKCEQMVSYWTVIDYLGTAALAFIAGFLLDSYPQMWRWFFCMAAFLGMLSTSILFFTTKLKNTPDVTPSNISITNKIKKTITKPWREVWHVLTTRKDFALYQIGFMLGGAGLMIMQPALPKFFIDILDLSFVELGMAIALCKGIGVAMTSSLWTRLFRKINLFQLSALVTFFACLFPFLLFASSLHMTLLYLAYGFYGIMQAGSELSWHMSGLVFAEEKDSSIFSATNVLSVGIRGCIMPIVGALLLSSLEPLGVILLGAFFCLLASLHFLLTSSYAKNIRARIANNRPF